MVTRSSWSALATQEPAAHGGPGSPGGLDHSCTVHMGFRIVHNRFHHLWIWCSAASLNPSKGFRFLCLPEPAFKLALAHDSLLFSAGDVIKWKINKWIKKSVWWHEGELLPETCEKQSSLRLDHFPTSVEVLEQKVWPGVLYQYVSLLVEGEPVCVY